MKQVQFFVVNDFQDVGVPADVQVGFLLLQDVPNLRQIMPWVTPDVGHVYMYVLHLEKQVLGVLQSDDMVVDIAMNSSKRFEGFELFGGFNVADVAGMPYLVNVLEEIKDLGDDDAMRVGKDADPFHDGRLLEFEQQADAKHFFELNLRTFDPYVVVIIEGDVVIVDEMGGQVAVEP